MSKVNASVMANELWEATDDSETDLWSGVPSARTMICGIGFASTETDKSVSR